MNTIFQEMLGKYSIVSDIDRKNAMKEIIQEIVLCGLILISNKRFSFNPEYDIILLEVQNG